MSDPDGEFVVVKSKGAVKKEKIDQKARGLQERRQAVLAYFAAPLWDVHDYTVTRAVGKLTRIGSRSNVGLHVTVNLADLEEAAVAGDLGYVRQNVRYHVTLEIGDDHYSADNPRWRSGSQEWEGDDAEDAADALRGAVGQLKSEAAAALVAARKAVRG